MSSPSILIIDDDPDFVDITKAVLETRQYKVDFAYNADEGFAKLQEEVPDVIILDIMMGKCAEGFIFARKMKKIDVEGKFQIKQLVYSDCVLGTKGNQYSSFGGFQLWWYDKQRDICNCCQSHRPRSTLEGL